MCHSKQINKLLVICAKKKNTGHHMELPLHYIFQLQWSGYCGIGYTYIDMVLFTSCFMHISLLVIFQATEVID